MKYSLVFALITLFNINSNAQTVQFNDLVAFENNDKVRFYLSGVFRISHMDCAAYYMTVRFEERQFKMTDTVRIFTMDNKLYQTYIYSNGKRNGLFQSYHHNGKPAISGKYMDDLRIGIWQYFYESGQKHKTIKYIDDEEYLIDFYRPDSKVTVSDGIGKFKDEVFLSIVNTNLSLIEGAVKNGLPESKWKISIAGTKIATENFKSNEFKKGVSHSAVLGDREYFDHSSSTFSGVNFMEHLKIITPSPCETSSGLYLDGVFFNTLKRDFENSEFKNNMDDNWFLIEIQSNNSVPIKNVSIYSRASQEVKQKLKNLILDLGAEIDNRQSSDRFGYFPLVIKNGIMYLPKDEEIELLRWRY